MSFPQVELNTNKGRIVLELNAEKAPKTVANFLEYVRDGFYDGVIFHRHRNHHVHILRNLQPFLVLFQH